MTGRRVAFGGGCWGPLERSSEGRSDPSAGVTTPSVPGCEAAGRRYHLLSAGSSSRVLKSTSENERTDKALFQTSGAPPPLARGTRSASKAVGRISVGQTSQYYLALGKPKWARSRQDSDPATERRRCASSRRVNPRSHLARSPPRVMTNMQPRQVLARA